MPTSQHLRRLVLFVCSLLAAVAVAEAALRVAGRGSHCDAYCIWPAHMDMTFAPSPEVMPGVSGIARFTTNSYGLRGDDPRADQTDRILTVGASTTECKYLDQPETWAEQLALALDRGEQRPRVWVGNAGISGTTSRHHALALERLPLQELRIGTVVLLAGINDLSTRLSHDADYDPHALDRSDRRSTLLAETFKIANDPDAAFYKRTALWRWSSLAKRVQVIGHIERIDGRNYTTWREHRRHAREIRPNLPDLSSALDEYARNLTRIVEIAAARGVRLVLMTQPALWRADLPKDLEDLLWLGGIGDFQENDRAPYYSTAALAQGMKAYNETLLRVCAETHSECLDLASLLRADTSIFYDDAHFNERGARKVAELLADYLRGRSDRG